MDKSMFTGVGTALVTPFLEQDGGIDYEAYRDLIEMQIRDGVDFLVPCGTTGESPTLDFAEHLEVIQAAVVYAAGRVPVLAGAGSNNTREAVALTEGAKNLGADGVLVVEPYYNKPPDEGALDYFRKVAKVGLPVILYTIPGRTAKGTSTPIIIKLAQEGSITGVKWASGDWEQLETLHSVCPELILLSGDDTNTLGLIKAGGQGVISVVSHLIPGIMGNIAGWTEENDLDTSEENAYWADLMRAMFISTNPIPVKEALALMHPLVFGPYYRSPMVRMNEFDRNRLRIIMRGYKLIA